MKTLQEIFNEIGNLTAEDRGGSDKGNPHIHTYLETYDKLFTPFRNGCHMVEIGLATGNSIDLWNMYFSNSDIVGIDISLVFDKPEALNSNRIHLIEEDATKPRMLKSFDGGLPIDLVCEDGSHQTNDQIATFNLFKPYMNKGGCYIMEDIQAWEIEENRYRALHDNIEVVDMRSNGRYDNMLLIFKF